MDEIILVGSGGHARACIDVIELSGKFKVTGLVEKDEISNIRSSVEAEIAEAVKFALESPDPEDATLYHNVYDS